MSKKMDKNEASAILSLSSKKEWDVFMGYIEKRLNNKRVSLEDLVDRPAHLTQGACKELKKFKKIVETANLVLEGQNR